MPMFIFDFPQFAFRCRNLHCTTNQQQRSSSYLEAHKISRIIDDFILEESKSGQVVCQT
ncbi:hypothetical protein ES332_D04G131700v1 [Gossypium tomentosum]|uniref:Uncharacterized protein n=1 Tax=Gossypium tomentosum TaxID=34277 RepID=A0A5D2LDA5_GOSTO|nr:hypothetical protein ES332_D04G131700v1 [Gossypium tomentosum]